MTGQITNRASLNLIAVVIVFSAAVLTILVSASSDDIVKFATFTDNLDGIVELNAIVDSWRIVEERDPSFASAVANTQVARSIVTPWVLRRAPLAGLCYWNICWVEIVLCRCRTALPVVIIVSIWAGKLV